MNGNMLDPVLIGIDNIIGCYRQTLPMIKLSGPTYFGPLLRRFQTYLQNWVGKNTYSLLLLLTDGQIMDMPATKEAIVDLSSLPCSIIIIGVGDQDWECMRELDEIDEFGVKGALLRD